MFDEPEMCPGGKNEQLMNLLAVPVATLSIGLYSAL